MADFVSGFWNVYVMGLVLLSLLFCAFIFATNMTGRKEGPVQLHGHVWDENIAEYNNPLPRWWLYLAWVTVFFSVGYLVIYPGFGNNQGFFNWSQRGQYEKEMDAAEKNYGPIFNQYLQQDLLAVAANPEANAMGKRLFLTYCAQCHGSTAEGAKGFPNLTDDEWMWGGEPAAIMETIAGGRMAAMPPFGGALNAEQVKDAANYVRSLSSLAHDSLRAQRGKEIFAENCVVCHGEDGKGNPMLGAPNLTNSVWLYGSSEATITETITKGRTNQMPTFREFLGDAKVHLLAAYVLSLNKKN